MADDSIVTITFGKSIPFIKLHVVQNNEEGLCIQEFEKKNVEEERKKKQDRVSVCQGGRGIQ